MVNNMPALDRVFGALADATRRDIVGRLASGEASISTLARPFDMSLVAVSKHIRVLESAGLVEQRKVGRTRYCRLRPEPMATADAWLRRYERFWTDQFEALDTYFQARGERP